MGGSKISVISLKTIANQLIGIEKINVGGMNGDGKKTKIEDEDLSALLKSLINLTHLAICKNRLK